MEASALPAGLTRGRAPLSSAFLRLRSDEQLVAMFRAGSDDAFRVIHDRYRVRLLAYARQMLRGAPGDAEDALQDVFLRAYRALRVNNRPVALRAWLYRVAHNRCIDELRRPDPLPSELAADAEPAFGAARGANEPPDVAERNAALARLVADVQTLPSQQRSALLMRELQGLTYAELATALGVSIPAVKSLLLRARTGLIDAATARDAPCAEICGELLDASDRSVRISGRARRHCSECASCEVYRLELRRVRTGLQSLVPGGPLAHLGMLLGLGGGGGAAAAGGSAAAGGGAAVASMTAAKLAVVVCCAALLGTAGRAVLAPSPSHPRPAAAAPVAHAASVPAPASALPVALTTPPVPRTVRPARTSKPHGGGPGNVTAVSGLIGTTGSSGATGASGPTGASGSTGAMGPTGASGTTGATGSVDGGTSDAGSGSQDATGASGATEATGATGSTTAVGATGATAATGTSGPVSAGA